MQLVAGQIARPHGVRGEVVVDVRTDEPERRFAPGSVFATGSGTPPRLAVRSARPHHGRLIVAFEGVDDRDGAEVLRGLLLWVDSDSVAGGDDPDEYHDYQLVGLAAVSAPGVDLHGGGV